MAGSHHWSCFVPGCSSNFRKVKDDPSLCIFRIPKGHTAKYRDFFQVSDIRLANDRICSKHWSEERLALRKAKMGYDILPDIKPSEEMIARAQRPRRRLRSGQRTTVDLTQDESNTTLNIHHTGRKRKRKEEIHTSAIKKRCVTKETVENVPLDDNAEKITAINHRCIKKETDETTSDDIDRKDGERIDVSEAAQVRLVLI